MPSTMLSREALSVGMITAFPVAPESTIILSSEPDPTRTYAVAGVFPPKLRDPSAISPIMKVPGT